MGRKGDSKRKPKTKSNSVSNSASPAESMPVASAVRGREAALGKGGVNPSAGASKSQKKH